MPSAPLRVRMREVERGLEAAKRAGFQVSRFVIDPQSGRTTYFVASMPREQDRTTKRSGQHTDLAPIGARSDADQS